MCPGWLAPQEGEEGVQDAGGVMLDVISKKSKRYNGNGTGPRHKGSNFTSRLCINNIIQRTIKFGFSLARLSASITERSCNGLIKREILTIDV